MNCEKVSSSYTTWFKIISFKARLKLGYKRWNAVAVVVAVVDGVSHLSPFW